MLVTRCLGWSMGKTARMHTDKISPMLEKYYLAILTEYFSWASPFRGIFPVIIYFVTRKEHSI